MANRFERGLMSLSSPPHIRNDTTVATLTAASAFAAGDCTGIPYQIAKAVGEGNIAAHNAVKYLSAQDS